MKIKQQKLKRKIIALLIQPIKKIIIATALEMMTVLMLMHSKMLKPLKNNQLKREELSVLRQTSMKNRVPKILLMSQAKVIFIYLNK